MTTTLPSAVATDSLGFVYTNPDDYFDFLYFYKQERKIYDAAFDFLEKSADSEIGIALEKWETAKSRYNPIREKMDFLRIKHEDDKMQIWICEQACQAHFNQQAK